MKKAKLTLVNYILATVGFGAVAIFALLISPRVQGDPGPASYYQYDGAASLTVTSSTAVTVNRMGLISTYSISLAGGAATYTGTLALGETGVHAGDITHVAATWPGTTYPHLVVTDGSAAGTVLVSDSDTATAGPSDLWFVNASGTQWAYTPKGDQPIRKMAPGVATALSGNNAAAALNGTANSLITGGTANSPLISGSMLGNNTSSVVNPNSWPSFAWIWSGSPIIITDNTYSNAFSQDPDLLLSRTKVSSENLASHGIGITDRLIQNNMVGYAAADARPDLDGGTGNSSAHVNAFQAIPLVSAGFSGTIGSITEFQGYGQVSSTNAVIPAVYGVDILDWSLVSSSTISAEYGLYVNGLSAGQSDWGLYVVSNQSYLGGGINTLSGGLPVSGTGALQALSTSFYPLETIYNPTSNAGVKIGYDSANNDGVIYANSAGSPNGLELGGYNGSGSWVTELTINPTSLTGSNTLSLSGAGSQGGGGAGYYWNIATNGPNNDGILLGYDSSNHDGVIAANSAGATNGLEIWCWSGSGWTNYATISPSGFSTTSGSFSGVLTTGTLQVSSSGTVVRNLMTISGTAALAQVNPGTSGTLTINNAGFSSGGTVWFLPQATISPYAVLASGTIASSGTQALIVVSNPTTGSTISATTVPYQLLYLH